MSIQLGNFAQINGRNTLQGINGSGIDAESIINGLSDARRIPATQAEDRIEVNNNQITAFGELRTLLSALSDATNFLRNPPGVGNDADNVFRFRGANITASTGEPASNFLSVLAQPGATIQNYNISEITSLASATRQRTDPISVADADTAIVSAGPTAGFLNAGTITINDTDVTLEAGDSLNQVVARFNEVSDATGVNVSIIQGSTDSFTLSFSATDTGSAGAFDLNDPAVTSDPNNIFGFLNSANLVTNGTFDTDISNFTDASLGTGAISFNEGALVVDGDGAAGNEAFAQQALTTVIGQEYTVTLDVASLENSAFIRIGNDGDVTLPGNSDIQNFEITEDGTATFTFTATDTTTFLTVNSDTNAAPFTVDNLSVVNSTPTPSIATTQTATDASFVIDGVTVTRSTNTISDVVDGLTFTLNQTTPDGTTLGLDVVPDTSLPLSGVSNFINTFNQLRVFVAEQTQLGDDGTFSEEAVLATESLLRNISSSLSSQVSGTVASAGTFTNLAQLGIEFADLPETADNPFVRNVLNIDQAAFESAIATDFDAVQDVFGLSFSSDDPALAIFSSSNSTTATNFSLNIDPANDTFEAVVDGETFQLDATELGSTGFTLSGPSGTPLAGLTLVYASTDATTANASISRGIADQIFNNIESILDEQTGQLELEVNSVEDSNRRLEAEIERIDNQVELFRESLIRQFSALESLLSSVNTLLTQLDTNQLVQFGN